MGLVRATNSFYARAYHHLHQHNRCPIPATGPALIAANHTAGLDPAIIQAACPRRIHWLMTRRFYDRPAMQWFFRWSGMIPIQVEGRDSRAWRSAIEQLRLGRIVGVFPEGRIERSEEFLPFQTGVALLAIRGGADIFPVYLDGLQRNTPMLHTYLLPHHPSIAWGAPLPAARCNPNRQTLHQVADELLERMHQLRRRFPAPRRRGRSVLAAPD
jgi:1-acyl-sn-glycerol-3-phosphate acyltransferase